MIEVQNVSKTYPTDIRANHSISFTVKQGEIVALVGPNGSGKTTLMQQMLGVLKIGEGSIRIDGAENNTQNIAYIPQTPAIYPALTVRESLLATTKYLGVPQKEAAERIDRVLEKTGLSRNARQPAYTLSGGQQKLLSFGCMLVQEAKNLVMDEVTSMVDVVTKEHIWQLILDEQKRGCAILLSSHDISEVKKLCTKLVVLQKGSVIFSGSPHEVRDEYCHCTIQVDNAIQTKTVLNEADCSYTHEGNDFSIVTQDITQMLKLLHELTKTVSIGSFSCEHPAFYDGLLSMLKNQEGN